MRDHGAGFEPPIEARDLAGLHRALREAPIDGATALAILERIAELEVGRA